MTFLILQPDSGGLSFPRMCGCRVGTMLPALRLNPEEAPSAFLIRPFSVHALPTHQTKPGMQGEEGCLER